MVLPSTFCQFFGFLGLLLVHVSFCIQILNEKLHILSSKAHIRSLSAKCTFPDSELTALQELYNSTNGDEWKWTGIPWNFQQSNPNPCEERWEGIQCSYYGLSCYVYNISLSLNNMNGTLPWSGWTAYTSLRIVSITDNKFLSGSIPSAFCDVITIYTLTLSNNSLSGTMPNCFSSTAFISKLNFDHNNLHGPIASSLGNLKYLSIIDLSYNRLSESIPDSLCNLATLTLLNFSNNTLTGTIPSCNKWKSLEYLNLEYNDLKGSIPSAICNMKKLHQLVMNNNQLTGTIPVCSYNSTFILEEINIGYNQLNGTIPPTWNELSQLRFVYVHKNRLTGTIPMFKLSFIVFNSAFNALTGTIPSSLFQYNAYRMYFSNNLFTGPIPESICDAKELFVISLYYNLLTGPIPSCNKTGLSNLYLVDLAANELDGTVPSWICKSGRSIAININFLSGNLDTCLESNNSFMQSLYFYINFFTGNINPSISNLTHLLVFFGNDNYLHGSVPLQLFEISKLFSIGLGKNMLSGSLPNLCNRTFDLINYSTNFFNGHIPSCFLTVSITLDISNNQLLGSLPSSANMNIVNELLLQGNKLSGPITPFIDNLPPTTISVLDISDNEFTGTLPNSLFYKSNLAEFIASINCFSGSVPTSMCDGSSQATKLQSLVLDGLATAINCRHSIVPTLSNSYKASHYMQGSIPSCIFSNYSSLQTLHLSGNGLEGSIPSISSLSPSLQDLALSYNFLTGTIPVIMQSYPWKKLDLSNNRLTGELKSNIFNFPTNASMLRLQRNRLSGELPDAIKNVDDIEILDGNMFSCGSGVNRQGIPQNDPDVDSYQCGSDNTNVSLLVWVAIILIILMTLFLMKHIPPFYLCMDAMVQFCQNVFYTKQEFSPKPCPDIQYFNIAIYLSLIEQLNYWIVRSIVLLVFLGIVLYIPLSLLFSTYTHTYVWIISIGFISGVAPAVVLFVLLWILLCLFFLNLDGIDTIFNLRSITTHLSEVEKTIWNRKGEIERESSIFSASIVTNQAQTPSKSYWKMYLQWGILLLINVAIILSVNMSYVYAENQRNDIDLYAKTLISVSVSVFKLVWGKVIYSCLSFVLQQINAVKDDHVDFTILVTWLSMFNNILSLLISNGFYNTSCLYYVFFDPPTVSSTFNILSCATQVASASVHPSTRCGVEVPASTEYQPPFNYSFQCNSQLLAIFIPVLVYRCLIWGILTPIALLCLGRLTEHIGKRFGKSHSLYSILSSLTPLNVQLLFMTEPSYDQLSNSQKTALLHRNIFDAYEDFMETMTTMAILLTYGSLFPPLAIIAGGSIMARSYFNAFILNEIQEKPKEHECWRPYLEKYNESLANTPMLWSHSFFSISFVISFIWACFLFDTLGDAEGGRNAIWIFVLGSLIPVLIYVLNVSKFHFFNWMAMRKEKNIAKKDEHGKVSRASEVELRYTTTQSYSSSRVSTVENPMLVDNDLLARSRLSDMLTPILQNEMIPKK